VMTRTKRAPSDGAGGARGGGGRVLGGGGGVRQARGGGGGGAPRDAPRLGPAGQVDGRAQGGDGAGLGQALLFRVRASRLEGAGDRLGTGVGAGWLAYGAGRWLPGRGPRGGKGFVLAAVLPPPPKTGHRRQRRDRRGVTGPRRCRASVLAQLAPVAYIWSSATHHGPPQPSRGEGFLGRDVLSWALRCRRFCRRPRIGAGSSCGGVGLAGRSWEGSVWAGSSFGGVSLGMCQLRGAATVALASRLGLFIRRTPLRTSVLAASCLVSSFLVSFLVFGGGRRFWA